jgi:phage terminase large subunit GpA-like protein
MVRRTVALLAPPPHYTVATWADERREIASGSSAEPGRYRAARLPYQIEPMEATTDPTVRGVVLEWARQLGKTTIIENLIGFIVDADPSNIFVKYPTREKAKDFSQKKLKPLIDATPCLRAKFKPHRMRDSGNTIYSKLFPGGSISMVGANSAAALRQLSCRVVIQDEIDSDQPNSEGDPVAQADATATNFHDAIYLKASTPTKTPVPDGKGGFVGSRIQILFNESDQRYWHVRCPHCAHWQVLKWAQVKWTWPQPDGSTKTDPSAAVYVCEGCQAELTDFERVRMVLNGKWVAHNPDSSLRGYHLSGLYRIMGKKRAFKTYLHEFVEGFLKAKRGGELETWVNTFLAECWSEDLAKLESNPLYARRERYTLEQVPAGVLVVTGAVDVQGDRLECYAKGWGAGFESWGLRHDILLGDPFRIEVWRRLAEWLELTFEHGTLGKLRIVTTLIDSGGQANDQGFAVPVYNFVRSRQPQETGPGVYASKGSAQASAALVTNRRPKRGICLKMLGTATAKTTIHARLRMSEHGPRFMHYNESFDEEWFEQLAAEAPRYVRRRGYTFVEWQKVRSRNEALDLEVMQLAAVEILNPNFAEIARRAGNKPPETFKSDARPAVPVKTAPRLFRPKFRSRFGR